MPHQLLPEGFAKTLQDAVKHFWLRRSDDSGPIKQGGTRDQVTSGKNLTAFADLVTALCLHCGLPAHCVHLGSTGPVLPGWFRATKAWDVLVIHEGRLLAAVEFKSQVGSFGNNFNNRSEESIGVAHDFWTAHEYALFRPTGEHATQPPPADPRPPFVGWMMLCEESDKSTGKISPRSPHFPADDAFAAASYLDRYRILCERMMYKKLYTRAALLVSEPIQGRRTGAFHHLSEATSAHAFFTALAAHLLAETCCAR